MANVFRFKQFSVDQTGCAMKINTDGVLLGAFANVAAPLAILDIGAGTGVISLMLAQRFSGVQIDAVEIDAAAADTARQNFAGSPFDDRLTLYPLSFQEFFGKYPGKKFDLIISNPPFYIHSLESPAKKKTVAKHAGPHFFEELIAAVAGGLQANGACWLILPSQTANVVNTIAADHKLFIRQTIEVKSYPDSVPHREIIVLSPSETKTPNLEFIIYDEPKKYSGEYIAALKDFFTIF